MKDITFAKESRFLGRNGEFKASGLAVSIDKEFVILRPLTSKGAIGRCMISVPKSSVSELIEALQDCMSDVILNDREQNIARIKEILKDWGATSSSELQLESSPCIIAIAGGEVSELIEDFNTDGVKTVVYNGELEIAWNDYAYEDLKDDIIDEILNIMEDYDTEMQKAGMCTSSTR